MTRIVTYFSGSQTIHELLSQFPLSQGPLYHYTNQQAAEGISKGEIWVTRADCFFDSSEIQHGISIIADVARQELNDNVLVVFVSLLFVIRECLKQCYVFSLSLDRDNPYLTSRYGKGLAFPEDFPRRLFSMGWHSVRNDGNSFRNYYFVDLYDFFEGSVIYDMDSKQRAARLVCEAFREIITPQAHIVDNFHFINILMTCCVLFKETKFANEEEYRAALVSKTANNESFEHSRTNKGRHIRYIAASGPPNYFVPEGQTS